MPETTIRTQAPTSTGYRGKLEATRSLLQLVYGLVPIVAGLDEFVNLLATWPDYLPAVVVGLLPVEPGVFMYVVGGIEVVAGLVVFSRQPSTAPTWSPGGFRPSRSCCSSAATTTSPSGTS